MLRVAGEFDFWLIKLAGVLSSLTLLAAPLYQYDFRVRRMRVARKLAEISEMEMTWLEAEKFGRRKRGLLRRSEIQILGFLLLIGAVIGGGVFLVASLPGKSAVVAVGKRGEKIPAAGYENWRSLHSSPDANYFC